MDQKCYQGEGRHGLKLYQGIIIRMDPLSYNAHHISIMSELYTPPTYMNAVPCIGIWVTYRMKMRTGNAFCSVTHVSRDFQ